MTIGQGFVDVVFESSRLREKRKLVKERVFRAAKDAVGETARELEQAYETETERAGLGKLAKAWNSKVYPEGGQLSDNPAGIVYPKGRARTEGAIKAYAEGATIRAKGGKFLAIALPAAGSRYVGKARISITPAEWERRTGNKLRFVPRRRGGALLVLDDGKLSKAGRARKNTASRRRTGPGFGSTVPIFVLVPIVRVQQRINLAGVRRPFAGKLSANFKAKLTGLDQL